MKQEEPILVAIHCLVYNHEPYLRDCFDGFVMQKTNFRYVAIVHDDCSTDGSVAIIREYAEKYPEIFRPIYEAENQWSKQDGTLERIMETAIDATEAKYVAHCEGDDFWIDPYKLQKQVDYLEEHNEIDLCCSASRRYLHKEKIYIGEGGTCKCECYETAIQGFNDIYTATSLMRKKKWNECYRDLSAFLPQDLIIDTAYWYWFAYHRKVKYMDEPMAVYRILENSASHTTDNKVQSYMQWRFLRLKLYFLSYYPLRENQKEVTQCILSEIKKISEWEHYCGQLETRNSKAYRLGKWIINPIKKIRKYI